jgi:hypothetical protein
MNTDRNGCSTCEKGQEHYEKIRMPNNKRINGVQYDYRDQDGELFSTVAINLYVARQRKADWLVKKLVKQYQDDPNCKPELWIESAGVNEEEKELFLIMVKQTVLGMRLSDLSLKDICEELTDIRKDLTAINDFNEGGINFGELSQRTNFLPSDKHRLEWAQSILQEEKIKRNREQN